eukprot:TRINITY_DN1185_c0_g2_i1.p1 TRINITY_DN1185_c0_g2~~TRINITY_DN1185_c0_g2_i1.p1  ORF type:complete len:317 (-),score=180.36 TRINITY_DN1185_c0_g2_i1:83-1033(-)
MSSTKATFATLNNGNKMPLFGLGTWLSKPNEVRDAVKFALENGYRHIDCAWVYQNEHEVGQALNEYLNSTTAAAKREDIFITSKLWCNSHRPEFVKPAIEATLKALQLNYIDLYLIHWPMAFQPGTELFPRGEDNKFIGDNEVTIEQTWTALEQLVEQGLVKSIGVSNFNISQIQRILNIAKIKPTVNQIEQHPFLLQCELSQFCKDNHILITGYSPLGNPARPGASSDEPSLLDNDTIKQIATKYNKSTAQILIRFHIDRGVSVIPKSVNPHRISENANIFDFELSQQDIQILSNLPQHRFVQVQVFAHLREFPF